MMIRGEVRRRGAGRRASRRESVEADAEVGRGRRRPVRVVIKLTAACGGCRRVASRRRCRVSVRRSRLRCCCDFAGRLTRRRYAPVLARHDVSCVRRRLVLVCSVGLLVVVVVGEDSSERRASAGRACESACTSERRTSLKLCVVVAAAAARVVCAHVYLPASPSPGSRSELAKREHTLSLSLSLSRCYVARAAHT